MAEKYLTMVGRLQWLVTLGRFDIHAQVATTSRSRAAPRQGHMDRPKRIYSYAISVEKSVFSIWVDLFLCRSIQLLVLSYA